MAGLHYAEGTFEMRVGKPASAFSKGDLLVLNSSSSLSRIAIIETGADIVGVAACSSLQSVDNLCTYLVPGFDTIFWSACTPGSTFTRGANVNYNDDAAGRPVANASTGTVRAVCHKGVGDVGTQSVESRIQVRLISNGGALTFS